MQKDIVRRDDAPESDTPPLVPTVDIWETSEGIDVAADLPGVTRDALHLGIDGETLTIEGTVSLGETPGMQPVHAEVRSPRFRRSFTLSRELDASRITATLRHGTLLLHIPRQEAAKPRRIEVDVSA